MGLTYGQTQSHRDSCVITQHHVIVMEAHQCVCVFSSQMHTDLCCRFMAATIRAVQPRRWRWFGSVPSFNSLMDKTQIITFFKKGFSSIKLFFFYTFYRAIAGFLQLCKHLCCSYISWCLQNLLPIQYFLLLSLSFSSFWVLTKKNTDLGHDYRFFNLWSTEEVADTKEKCSKIDRDQINVW